MSHRRTLLFGCAALALFALTGLAGKGGKPPPPEPPPAADPAILYTLSPGTGSGEERKKHEIWVMNEDGSNQTPVLTYETHGLYPFGDPPQWSRDNSRFVFRGRPEVVGGPLDLYVADSDGSNVTRVLDGSFFGGIGNADWLPGQDGDDEWIIFSGWPDNGNREDLYAIRADGTGLVQLTDTAERYESWPRVSPDGAVVVYGTFYDTALYRRLHKATLGFDGGVPVLTDEVCLTDIEGTTLASRNCYDHSIDPTGTYVLLRTGSPNNYRWLVPLANPAAAWRTPIPPGRGVYASWLDPDTVVYEGSGDVVTADVSSGEETTIATFGKNPVLHAVVARRWFAGS